MRVSVMQLIHRAVPSAAPIVASAGLQSLARPLTFFRGPSTHWRGSPVPVAPCTPVFAVGIPHTCAAAGNQAPWAVVVRAAGSTWLAGVRRRGVSRLAKTRQRCTERQDAQRRRCTGYGWLEELTVCLFTVRIEPTVHERSAAVSGIRLAWRSEAAGAWVALPQPLRIGAGKERADSDQAATRALLLSLPLFVVPFPLPLPFPFPCFALSCAACNRKAKDNTAQDSSGRPFADAYPNVGTAKQHSRNMLGYARQMAHRVAAAASPAAAAAASVTAASATSSGAAAVRRVSAAQLLSMGVTLGQWRSMSTAAREKLFNKILIANRGEVRARLACRCRPVCRGQTPRGRTLGCRSLMHALAHIVSRIVICCIVRVCLCVDCLPCDAHVQASGHPDRRNLFRTGQACRACQDGR